MTTGYLLLLANCEITTASLTTLTTVIDNFDQHPTSTPTLNLDKQPPPTIALRRDQQ